MRPESHTARAYLMTDRVIRAFETWIIGKVKTGHGYAPAAISRRLAQAVSMQLTDSFLRMCTVDPLKGTVDRLEELPEQLYCGEMKIKTKSGVIAPTPRLLIVCLAKFSALWFFVLWHYLRSLANRNVDIGAAALVYGVPDADLRAGGSPKRFEDFCQFGPLDVLSESNKYIVQATAPIKAESGSIFIYSRYPLLALLLEKRLRFLNGISFLWGHFLCIVGYVVLLLRYPIACLLWRDYAELALAQALNTEGLIKVTVITNTNWLQQFLWMSDLPGRKHKVYMALYSLNTSPLIFKDDPIIANHPSIRHLRVDCIWIWDASYEQILRDEGVFCATKVVGPILWYLPEYDRKYEKRHRNIKRVCLFDVSPQSNEALLRSGMLGNYYSIENAKLFLDDVLAALNYVKKNCGHEIEIFLKHKRTRTSIHDQSYFSYVDELSGSLGVFRVVSEDSNLFSLISECDLIIVVPYSSPAFIADFLGTPSIYYDPSGELRNTVNGLARGRFANSKFELVEHVKSSLDRLG